MFCTICKMAFEAFTDSFEHEPWIDNKPHKEICHTCLSVPKMYNYDEKTESLVVFETFDPK